jgi:hypothetical protein
VSSALQTPQLVLVFGLAATVLYFFLWRALVTIFPGWVKTELEAPAEGSRVPDELKAQDEALRSLGFTLLGTRSEKAPLSPELISFDYSHPEKVFATAFLARDGRPRLYFLSRTDRGAIVISANYRRAAREIPGRYFSSSLEDCTPERLYRAHTRTVPSFGAPVGPLDQEGRLELARAWFAGPGKLELRLQNLPGLLWTVAALGMVGHALFGR